MGLLMVGYGLRDSITSIADHQYDELHLYDNSIFISDSMEAEEKNAMKKYLTENENVASFRNAAMVSMQTSKDKKDVDVYLTLVEDEKNLEDFFVFRDRRSKGEF